MIDTHVHFWSLSRDDYGWLKPGSGMLYRDYMPEHLYPELQSNGITGVIAVQAAATVEETVFLLGLADQYDWIQAVVGWLDVGSARFDLQYEQVRSHPRFAGIRIDPSITKPNEPGRRERVREHLTRLAEEGHRVELIARPQYLPLMLEILEEVPELRVIVNHLGLPLVGGAVCEDWQTSMRRLADRPLAMCKLSGMTGFVDNLNAEAFKPYVEELFKLFGADRLLFGSDWPVCLQTGSYAEVKRFFYESLPDGEHQEDQGGTWTKNVQQGYPMRKEW